MTLHFAELAGDREFQVCVDEFVAGRVRVAILTLCETILGMSLPGRAGHHADRL